MIYVYDGTFEGYLTAVFNVFENKDIEAEIISRRHFMQQSLFGSVQTVTDYQKSFRVANGLSNLVSINFLHEIYYLFLADTIDCGTIALKYIRQGIKFGKKLYQLNYTPDVDNAIRLKRRVLLENHRFKGLVRFSNFKEVFFANIEPDHNILSILYPHFDRRLPNIDWIIRDNKRQLAALHFDGRTDICECDKCEVEISDEYEDVWREFYKAIAIKERENPRLQKSWMPKRYWKNIVETQNK